ncbi:VOC family protein [Frankia sp. Cpl3]|nr:VOC family protein [Frankia sp. Cpl3]
MKLPVSDLPRSLAWYRMVFGAQPILEFPDEDDVVRGVACTLPGLGSSGVSLRENPAAAAAIAGFNALVLAVEDRAAIEAWTRRLDDLGVAHSPVIDATVGWLLVLHDPDGIEIHLYSEEHHGIDQTGRPGYGRPVRPSDEPAPPAH